MNDIYIYIYYFLLVFVEQRVPPKCYGVCIINESQREETYLLKCAPNDDSNQPAHAHSLISLYCLYEELFASLLSKLRQIKILISIPI